MRIKKVYSGKTFILLPIEMASDKENVRNAELRVHAEDNKRIYCRAHPNISDKLCTEEEFSSFLKRLTNDKYPVPRKTKLSSSRSLSACEERSQENMEDIKKMIALNNKYRKKAITFQLQKIEAKRKLAVVESEIPEDEEAMKEREEQIEKLKEKYADLVRQEERAREAKRKGSTHGKNQREKSIRQHFKERTMRNPKSSSKRKQGR